ncbi:NADH-quinone oxidoreductase subunit NuoE [Streptomyces sp. NPDC008150]|uniref:NADH-quinone oxidoreductase subunit NuoE n=1 Tax=Streptomyces sp. NPDC008150 TaxID=3364816 RepID=UPI0036E4154B
MTTSSSERGVSLGMPELPAPGFPDDVRTRLEQDARAIVARYPDSRSALLPLLHLMQAEEGHVTRTGMRFCAEVLGLTTAEVTAVATFYSMYRRRPSGDYQVGVCTNTLCAVMGGDAIFESLQEHLGVGNGETTDDGKVTLEHIECNAACDFAPVVMVNWEFFDNQTPATARRLVDDLRDGRTVSPTRGAPLCTFKETARILAGFPDEREGAVEAGGGAGHASLEGLRLAKGETAPARVVHPRDGGPHDEAQDRDGRTPDSGHAPGTGTRQNTGTGSETAAEHRSSHDAPQDTSASDPAHPAGPTAEEGE